MAISQKRGEALRDNSRMLSILFQVLAVLSLVATAITAITVARVGSQVGVPAKGDPVILFIILGGVASALIFTSIGHVLGMLCTIYDRQDRKSVVQQSKPLPPPPLSPPPTTPPPQSITPNPSVWTQIVEKDESETKVETPAPLPTNQTEDAPNGLRGWLTRERHFSSGKGG